MPFLYRGRLLCGRNFRALFVAAPQADARDTMRAMLTVIALHLIMKGPVWSLLEHIDLTGSSENFHRSRSSTP